MGICIVCTTMVLVIIQFYFDHLYVNYGSNTILSIRFITVTYRRKADNLQLEFKIWFILVRGVIPNFICFRVFRFTLYV